MSPTGTPIAPTMAVSGSVSTGPSPASTICSNSGSNASSVPTTPGSPNADSAAITAGFAVLSVDDQGQTTISVYTPPHRRTQAPPNLQGLEDVFIASPQTPTALDSAVTSPGEEGRTAQTPTAGRASSSSNWRSGSSSEGSGSGQASPSGRRLLFQRSGRVGDSAKPVTGDDAQGHFPPSCCVFVANLLQSEDEETLEAAVLQIFREYGTVYVKVRRDHNHMPFAFCQYTRQDDAAHAIREGRGRLIFGRPCRCEKAKAHRLFFIEKAYGPTVTVDEVRAMLQEFGRLTLCRPIHPMERSFHNLNDGVIVEFEMYDQGQLAVQRYRGHEKYKMTSMANMHAPRSAGSDPAARQYTETYYVDIRSIFVGNLPADATEAEIHLKFEEFGPIAKDGISLHKSESSVDVNEQHCFAFIEFLNRPSALRAAEKMHRTTWGGKTLRVAQKDTDGAKKRKTHTSAVASAAGFHGSSPSPRPLRRSGPQSASPMAHVSPVGYGSPYSYSHGSPFYAGYSGTSFFGEGQGQYYAAPQSPYSPYYYYAQYSGSPTYHHTGAPSTPAVTGSPAAQPYYGYYPGYVSNAPAPYWGVQSDAQSTAYSAAYSAGYSPTMTGSTVQEDRSATPTPAGNAFIADSSLESQ